MSRQAALKDMLVLCELRLKDGIPEFHEISVFSFNEFHFCLPAVLLPIPPHVSTLLHDSLISCVQTQSLRKWVGRALGRRNRDQE